VNENVNVGAKGKVNCTKKKRPLSCYQTNLRLEPHFLILILYINHTPLHSFHSRTFGVESLQVSGTQKKSFKLQITITDIFYSCVTKTTQITLSVVSILTEIMNQVANEYYTFNNCVNRQYRHQMLTSTPSRKSLTEEGQMFRQFLLSFPPCTLALLTERKRYVIATGKIF
jgi:hypothetical protein